MSSAPISIAVCSDANYAPHLATTLQSIFEHNREAALDVHVICTDGDLTTRNRIEQVARSFGRTLSFHVSDSSGFNHLVIREHFSHAVYLRLLLPGMLPDVSRLIYLDCDLLVEAPLAPLWATDVEGMACAGVPETGLAGRLGVERYVNSGVLLMNLDYWRRHEIAAQCIAWLANNREQALMVDQDAINVVLQGKIVFVPGKWNLNSADELGPDSLEAHPERVLHFAGPYKPWHRYYDFGLAEIYRKYRAATPWGDEFRLKEPETGPQALLVAHQLVAQERFQEAYGYFEQALRDELAWRKLDSLLQMRVVNVARALAGGGEFRQACELQRACFEQWGYPNEYQGQVYAFQQARTAATLRARGAGAR